MIVLGKNNGDKGKQLEKLALGVLKYLGFTNLRLREIGLGGMELDLTGRYSIPMPGETESVEIIGECKAKREPVDMTDWLKLVGKLHVTAKETGDNAVALLLSVSGYNMNVLSAYERYRRVAKDVRLIEPEAFDQTVQKLFEVCGSQALMQSLQLFTPEQPTQIELAYYDGHVYWTLQFDGRRVAYMTAQGNRLDTARARAMHKMYVSQFGRFAFVDLDQEGEALRRQRMAAKTQVAALFLLGGAATLGKLFADPEFSEEEHRSALRFLKGESIVKESKGTARLAFLGSPDRAQTLSKTISFWITDLVPSAYIALLFGSELYEASIDGDLVEHARKTQGNLPIPRDREEEVVEWMRLSPSALLNALTPQQMLVQHRIVDPVNQPDVDEYDLRWFYNLLFDSFLKDFHNQALCPLFFTLGIHEVEQITAIRVKGPEGSRRVERSPSRTLIAPLTEEIGGTFALVSAMHTLDEPQGMNLNLPSFKSNLRKATADKASLYGAELPTLRGIANVSWPRDPH